MVNMNVRVVELGPFGCRIDRGITESIEDVPEGYEVMSIETGPDTITVYIEPTRKKKPRPSQ